MELVMIHAIGGLLKVDPPLKSEEALVDAESKLTKAQSLIRNWQLSVAEQNVRKDLSYLGRAFSGRINTMEPFLEALISVREAIESRDILQNTPGKSQSSEVFIQKNDKEFKRLKTLALTTLNDKAKEQEKWTSSSFWQWCFETDESVTKGEVANKLVSEGRNWDSKKIVHFIVDSDLEKADKTLLTRDAKWNVYSRVGLNVALTGAIITGAILARSYLGDKEPVKTERFW